MNNITSWIRGHAAAMLAAGIVVAKSGLLGKVALALVTALTAATSAST